MEIDLQSVEVVSLDPLFPAICELGTSSLDMLDLLSAFPELLLAIPFGG